MLLEQFRTGRSDAAFAAIVHRHAGWVWHLARRRLRDDHLADDVTQVVFTLLFRKAGTFRRSDRLAGWLTRVTHYTVMQAARKEARVRRLSTSSLAVPVAADAVEQVEAVETIGRIDEAIQTLPERERDLIARRFYGGQSFQEIGHATGVSADSVRKRLDRLIIRLRRRLGADVSPDFRTMLPALGVPAGGVTSSTVSSILTGAAQPDGALTAVQCSLLKGTSAMLFRAKVRSVLAAAAVIAVSSVGVYALCVPGDPVRSASDRAETPSTQPAPATPRPLSESVIYGEHVLIRLSADETKLIGYSMLTGTWEVAPIDDAREGFRHVVVASNVAFTTLGKTALGFSATTGQWASVELPSALPNSPDVGLLEGDGTPVVVASEWIRVYAGGKLYLFSGNAGNWAEPMP